MSARAQDDDVNGNNRSFERLGLDSRLAIRHGSFGMRNETELGLRVMDEKTVDQPINAKRATPTSGTLAKDVVKNLTDERYIASLHQGVYVGPERSVEVGATYRC